MNLNLPRTIDALPNHSWQTFEPAFQTLLNTELSQDNFRAWLLAWSDLSRVVSELFSRTYINTTLDTGDKEAEGAFNQILEDLYPQSSKANQALKEKLIAFDPQDEDLSLMMRDMRTEAELYREENIPLLTQLQKMGKEYDKLTGGLTVDWEGESLNLSQLLKHLSDKDRTVREKAWTLYMDSWATVREPLNELFLKMLDLRRQVSANAGFDTFREFAFLTRSRFDYTPQDCLDFHRAIEAEIVPIVKEQLGKLQVGLELEAVRPWDWMPEKGLIAEAGDAPPLAPYATEDELIQKSINIFNQVDPELGHYFVDMAESDLLDLQSRPGKAMGGYCSTLNLTRKPFIFMNGIGNHDTVQTLLHEAGHAFHAYEGVKPLIWQESPPLEFCEVASMAMELLAAPYLTEESGGFYSESEAARARIEHLVGTMLFLPYMATVDAFQHWLYTTDEPISADTLDAKWLELEERFLGMINYEGHTEPRMSGWHRKLHIFHIPFYYIEYGMASIGALQVWRNSLNPEIGQAQALADYRTGLSLGSTKTLPELFEAAGAEFRFDTDLLSELGSLVKRTIGELESTAHAA